MKQSFKVMMYMLCCSLFAVQAFSQERKLSLQLQYNVQTPVGAFKNDLISKTSFNGISAGLMYNISDRFSLGGQTGYSNFREQFPRQLYDTKQGTISAVMTNYVRMVPLQAKSRYQFMPGAAIQPYVGLAAGVNMVTFNQYLGEFGSTKTGVHFAATPDAGIMVPFSKYSGSAFTLGANFNYVPYNYSGIEHLNNWGVYAGVKFSLR